MARAGLAGQAGELIPVSLPAAWGGPAGLEKMDVRGSENTKGGIIIIQTDARGWRGSWGLQFREVGKEFRGKGEVGFGWDFLTAS